MNDENHLKKLIDKCVKMKLKKASLEISPVEKINTYVDSTSPQTSFDQMPIMADQHQAATSNTLNGRTHTIPHL